MLISSEDGAGEILAPHHDTRFYDDVRCLSAEWAADHESAAAFVHLRDSGWIDARSASYARPLTARTPMGSGLVAFATAEQARAADRSGRTLTWDEVAAQTGDGR
jgi:nitrous oxide reductase accessory protein NosL